MIVVRYSGRLGNNLFQYCFARILAENRGDSLFSEDDFLYSSHFSNIEFHQATPNAMHIVFDETRNFDFNISELLAIPPQMSISLTGYFQKFKYYKGYVDQIREWLYLPESNFQVGKNDIILHFRRDDYLESGSELPFSYYKDILQSKQFDKIYITGDIDEAVKDAFACYLPNIVELPPIDTLQFMKQFDNIVIANSTFSWWGAYLSNASNVWFPIPKKGYWSAEQNQDLYVDGWHKVIL
jgi:hypothetical protein